MGPITSEINKRKQTVLGPRQYSMAKNEKKKYVSVVYNTSGV